MLIAVREGEVLVVDVVGLTLCIFLDVIPSTNDAMNNHNDKQNCIEHTLSM